MRRVWNAAPTATSSSRATSSLRKIGRTAAASAGARCALIILRFFALLRGEQVVEDGTAKRLRRRVSVPILRIFAVSEDTFLAEGALLFGEGTVMAVRQSERR